MSDDVQEVFVDGSLVRTPPRYDDGKSVMSYEGETSTERMMRIALQEGKIDALEKLIELKNREEDRAARKAFDEHFAVMQRKLKPILKTKDGSKTDAGVVAFKYAPLEDIEKENKPIINKAGFSYRWREEERENGEKRVRIIISGWGWTDTETYFDVPKVATNRLTTDVQTRGIQSSYGRRYTFISGFGITIEGEDDESKLTFDDAMTYHAQLTRIKDAKTIDGLRFILKEIWPEMGNDQGGKDVITKAYNQKKIELGGSI